MAAIMNIIAFKYIDFKINFTIITIIITELRELRNLNFRYYYAKIIVIINLKLIFADSINL